MIKNLPAKGENIREVGSIPRLGRSPGGGMATQSDILAWRIPWTEEPGGLNPGRRGGAGGWGGVAKSQT